MVVLARIAVSLVVWLLGDSVILLLHGQVCLLLVHLVLFVRVILFEVLVGVLVLFGLVVVLLDFGLKVHRAGSGGLKGLCSVVVHDILEFVLLHLLEAHLAGVGRELGLRGLLEGFLPGRLVGLVIFVIGFEVIPWEERRLGVELLGRDGLGVGLVLITVQSIAIVLVVPHCRLPSISRTHLLFEQTKLLIDLVGLVVAYG